MSYCSGVRQLFDSYTILGSIPPYLLLDEHTYILLTDDNGTQNVIYIHWGTKTQFPPNENRIWRNKNSDNI